MRSQRNQWKVILVVFVVLVGTISAVVWKTQSLLLEDKLSSINDASVKQIAPLRRLVQERLEERKAKLVRFAAQKVSNGNAQTRAFNDFDVVGLVLPTGGQWTPSWIEKNPVGAASKWPNGFETTLVRSLPFAKVRDGEVTWVRVSDTQGLPVYVVMVSVEVQSASAGTQTEAGQLPESTDYGATTAGGAGQKAVLVGFSSANPLMTITEDYIGSTNIIYMVDERGYVASHTNKAFVGALFTEDPVVQEIMRLHKTAGTSRYEDLESRAVIGHFERIDRTNLFAVIETPTAAATAIVDSHLRMALSTAAIAGFVGLLLAWAVGRSLSGHEPGPAAETGETADDRYDTYAANTVAAESAVQPAPLQPAQNETESGPSFSFVEDFTEVLKEPVNAILAHAQLAKSKAVETEVKSHAESIEREARRATGIVEALRGLKAAETAPAAGEQMDLAAVANGTIETMRADLEASGIKINLDLKAVPVIRGSAERLSQALKELITNAREALNRRQEKVITIRLGYEPETISLSVIDTGIGMSRDERGRAFDLFFKKFESPERIGMGLSLIKMALDQIGATCEIDSSPGAGTVCTLKFNVTSDERRAFVAAQAEKTAQEIARQFRREGSLAAESVSETEAVAEAEAEAAPQVAAKPAEQKVSAAEAQLSPFAGTMPAVNAEHLGFLDDDDEDEPILVELGGKKPLTGEQAEKLPPFKLDASMAMLESDSSEDDDEADDDVLDKTIASAILAAKASSMNRQAAVAVPLEEDEDEDEDEPFSSVPLNRAAASQQQVEVSPQGEVSPKMESGRESGFQVKIRRPKMKE